MPQARSKRSIVTTRSGKQPQAEFRAPTHSNIRAVRTTVQGCIFTEAAITIPRYSDSFLRTWLGLPTASMSMRTSATIRSISLIRWALMLRRDAMVPGTAQPGDNLFAARKKIELASEILRERTYPSSTTPYSLWLAYLQLESHPQGRAWRRSERRTGRPNNLHRQLRWRLEPQHAGVPHFTAEAFWGGVQHLKPSFGRWKIP